MNPILNVFSITKTFGNLIANDNITFEVNKGEVLAILGENGAGKTTLMNILFGHYTPDKGQISFEGQQMTFGNTGNAISLGIGMVHQHFTLAENLVRLLNLPLDLEELRSAAETFDREVTKAIDKDNQLQEYINKLEIKYDESSTSLELTSPSEIVDELEQFLKANRRDDST